MSTQGKFVWHELATQDPEAALKFYGELFGWTYKTGEMGPMKYHEIMVQGRPIGGITGIMGPARPAAWSGYVTVDDVDAAVQRALRNGGKVLTPAMDIPDTGRFAVLADPTGAALAPFSYPKAAPDKSDLAYQPGTFGWNELMTDDTAAAGRFYGEVYGWSLRAQDMGPMGTYHLFQHEGKDVAGMMTRPPEAPVSFWMYYVLTEDTKASLQKAVALGAKACMEPMDVPGVGRIAAFNDPTGAMIALFQGESKQA